VTGSLELLPADASPRDAVLPGLREAAVALAEAGVSVPSLDGKLLRSVMALGLVPADRRSELDLRFWSGALAVEMAHEASLLHDDVVDASDRRRGVRTVAAERGPSAALLQGDEYLTGSYRAAARTGSSAFLDLFLQAVHETVVGERRQGRSGPRALSPAEYEELVAWKTGRLFGAAAALSALVPEASPVAEARAKLGEELGVFYQMVDDLLDYCPAAETGKPGLQDYRRGTWTWLLGIPGAPTLSAESDDILQTLTRPAKDRPPLLRRALEQLESRASALEGRVQAETEGCRLLITVFRGWVAMARTGVEAQLSVGEPSRTGERAESGEATNPAVPSRAAG